MIVIRFADYYDEQFITVWCTTMTIKVNDKIKYYVCKNENGDIVGKINSYVYHIISVDLFKDDYDRI